MQTLPVSGKTPDISSSPVKIAGNESSGIMVSGIFNLSSIKPTSAVTNVSSLSAMPITGPRTSPSPIVSSNALVFNATTSLMPSGGSPVDNTTAVTSNTIGNSKVNESMQTTKSPVFSFSMSVSGITTNSTKSLPALAVEVANSTSVMPTQSTILAGVVSNSSIRPLTSMGNMTTLSTNYLLPQGGSSTAGSVVLSISKGSVTPSSSGNNENSPFTYLPLGTAGVLNLGAWWMLVAAGMMKLAAWWICELEAVVDSSVLWEFEISQSMNNSKGTAPSSVVDRTAGSTNRLTQNSLSTAGSAPAAPRIVPPGADRPPPHPPSYATDINPDAINSSTNLSKQDSGNNIEIIHVSYWKIKEKRGN
ncbi:unnamed protein product [Ranitomeya imitator]|uniref:Uncharacterized protein n=1 Tax=Ranitomeya imitator TaxID=111125 RepID=A0ABN9MDM9_9NEOB|nr:unnamed protein product [Ranitomeya imitator]